MNFPPEHAEPLVSFRVDGEPKPAGSKMSGVVTRWDDQLKKRVPVERPGGGWKTFTKDSAGKPGEDWRGDLRSACADALDIAHELVDAPLVVRVTFFIERPKGHYGTGRNAGVLKDSADRFPHQSKLPDGTKLARALEDALTKLVWVDDRRIVDLWWARRFGKPGAMVQIWTLPRSVGSTPDDQRLSLLGADAPVIMGCHGDEDRSEALAV